MLLIGKIYDAGGSARRDISSQQLVEKFKNDSFRSYYLPERNNAGRIIKEYLSQKKTCFVVGARDRSLRDFARESGRQQEK